jgi:hypothetical protein
LIYDRLIEYNRKLSEKLQAKGDQKRVEELKEGRDFINQMKDLENQSLQLGKELLESRGSYDFKTVDEIRKKQEALKEQSDELQKKTRTKMKQLEENQDLEEQNL